MNIRMQVTAAALVAMLGAFPAAVAAQQPAKLTAVKAAKAAIPVQPIPAASAARPADYRLEALGMGDMIRVSVFRNPDLTTEARVSERGTVMFPLIGEISVNGLTPTQVSKQIADKLRAGGFVVDPEVTVSIAQVNSRQVAVLGNVQKPGRYPLDATTAKVTDLIALAGGI